VSEIAHIYIGNTLSLKKSLGVRKSSSAEEQAFVFHKLHCCSHLAVVTMFVMWLTMKLFVDKKHIEIPTHLGMTPDIEIFISSAQYPKIHLNSSVDGDSLMNEFDTASLFSMMRHVRAPISLSSFIHKTHLIHARESKNQCRPSRSRPLLSSQSLIPSYLDFIIV
jgi:hypothetical protein